MPSPESPEPHFRALGIAPSSESDPMPPVDLRTLPREHWPGYEAAPLQIPDDIARYLSGRDFAAEPLTPPEIESIENCLSMVYHLAPDFQATYAADAFRLQRA